MTDSNLEQTIVALARRALEVSRELAVLPTATKNAALLRLAEKLEAGADALREANARDLAQGRADGLSPAMLDRLELTPKRITAMAEGVRQVAALPDPVGQTIGAHTHAKGFEIRKVRVPIGVIGIIYESRPNVTVDCAALCLKSGNATILRGGKEAFHSNQALVRLIGDSLAEAGIPTAAVQFVPTTDREALRILLHQDDSVHCIIPRGGEGLIRFVAGEARMPVIKHYKGVCNVFIDAAADPAMARAITLNAKCQRPGVCNAAENLIIHRSLLDGLFLDIARDLQTAGVELRVDADAARALATAGIPHQPASAADYDEEYLALVLAVKTVADLDDAVAFINRHGSGHSDAIITADARTAEAFLSRIDSATVYWNASTRFTDGFEFGLGAEIGISTDRLHARGPMGLEELTSYKYQIRGHGDVRG